LTGLSNGLIDCTVQKLTILNNEIGEKTFEILDRKYIELLRFLSLGNIKINSEVISKLFYNIKENGINIKFLSLTGFNLRIPEAPFNSLIEYVSSHQSVNPL
jgi:hypothetical protein